MGGIIEQEKYELAKAIAFQAGVLQTCSDHDECTLSGEANIKRAYKLADEKISRGELTDTFRNVSDLKDAIEEVVSDEGMDECGRCEDIEYQ